MNIMQEYTNQQVTTLFVPGVISTAYRTNLLSLTVVDKFLAARLYILKHSNLYVLITSATK